MHQIRRNKDHVSMLNAALGLALTAQRWGGAHISTGPQGRALLPGAARLREQLAPRGRRGELELSIVRDVLNWR